jgi:hypothetical protein
LYTL